MIYSLLIYREKSIIHFEGFRLNDSSNDPLLSLSPKATDYKEHSLRLIMGMMSGLTGMIAMLSGPNSSSKFESFTTPEYRLDYYETVSGYKFVVMSPPNPHVSQVDIRADFDRLYSLLFVPLVIRNPLFDPEKPTGNLRDSHCLAFVEELRTHFRSLARVGTEAPILHVGPHSTSLPLQPLI